MKKIIVSIIAFTIFVCGNLMMNGCAATKEISEKSGVQLWGENCNRCHNAPSMDQFNKDQWDIVGTHMKIRANVTHDEVQKIVTFLQTGQ